jgi:hypothetical protein
MLVSLDKDDWQEVIRALNNYVQDYLDNGNLEDILDDIIVQVDAQEDRDA